jgi:hypothetical protein
MKLTEEQIKALVDEANARLERVNKMLDYLHESCVKASKDDYEGF